MEFYCLPGVIELEAVEGSKSPARFKKELLRSGTYTHPQDPQLQLTITPERMEKWVAAFKAAPFKVYVPLRHTKDPAQNAGWLEDLFLEVSPREDLTSLRIQNLRDEREEERLYGILCITDEEIAQKIREGTIRDVSIAVEKDVTDADGHTYEELITHVALTLDPHFREQEPFLELEDPSLKGGPPKSPIFGVEIEEEIKGYLAAGKITPASVPYLRMLLTAETPPICFESGELKFGEYIRTFLATLPAVVDYRELGQVEISGPPGGLSIERAEKEARRILHR